MWTSDSSYCILDMLLRILGVSNKLLKMKTQHLSQNDWCLLVWSRRNIASSLKRNDMSHFLPGILGGYQTDDVVPPLNKFGCVLGGFKEEKKKPFWANKGQILPTSSLQPSAQLNCASLHTKMDQHCSNPTGINHFRLRKCFSSGLWLCCLMMQSVTICKCNFIKILSLLWLYKLSEWDEKSHTITNGGSEC